MSPIFKSSSAYWIRDLSPGSIFSFGPGEAGGSFLCCGGLRLWVAEGTQASVQWRLHFLCVQEAAEWASAYLGLKENSEYEFSWQHILITGSLLLSFGIRAFLVIVFVDNKKLLGTELIFTWMSHPHRRTCLHGSRRLASGPSKAMAYEWVKTQHTFLAGVSSVFHTRRGASFCAEPHFPCSLRTGLLGWMAVVPHPLQAHEEELPVAWDYVWFRYVCISDYREPVGQWLLNDIALDMVRAESYS
jgi:hypothetical protein